ncbi:MAG: galactokinase [Chloroflexi bacterium]|nr:MAG: galactokinase [Chloroflexota bacterium]
MSLQQFVTDAFVEQFGERPSFIVRAPGRVNLIGEHTDYNDGFVLPMAIDRAIWIALRPRDDRQVSVTTLDYGETETFSLDTLEKGKGWIEYIKGTAWAMQEAGYALNGWEGVLKGDIPKGAGLSSSAALEMATTQAFNAVSDFEWKAPDMALLGQKAENKWVGVNTGIMDQMISAAGKDGQALLIDCRTLEHTLVPLPPASDGAATAVIVLDTATRRGLVGSAYDERRQQCETAAAYFEVKALRDVSMAEFLGGADGLEPLPYKRAKHVVTENLRTLNAAKAMQNADAELMGQLMNESHTSMHEDFEITNKELHIMAKIAQQQEGCFGARMTGGGFGGCAVALVHEGKVEGFVTAVATAYEAATNLKPNIYVCRASAGAEIVSG